jgi:Tripartite tricarboxylate transporter family receptor
MVRKNASWLSVSVSGPQHALPPTPGLASEPRPEQVALVPDAKFKMETELAPLIQIGTAYNVLVVNPSVPVTSVAELIAYLNKNPGKYTFSSGGFGRPRTCSASCSSSKPERRQHMCPTPNLRRRSAT